MVKPIHFSRITLNNGKSWCVFVTKQKFGLLLFVVTDALIIGIAPFLAMLIRFEGEIPQYFAALYYSAIPWTTVVNIGVLYLFGLYNRLWRYASIRELTAIIGAVTANTVIDTFLMYFFFAPYPRSVTIITWFLSIALIGASRFLARLRVSIIQRRKETANRVLIIGAGDAGAMIAREIQHHYRNVKTVVGFIDDDPFKLEKTMYGIRVLGGLAQMEDIIMGRNVGEVIIAMPSVSGEIVKKYVAICKKLSCKVQIVPGVYDLIDGNVSLGILREVQVEDLLRREPVHLSLEQISDYLRGKVVLVSGAGGSIGSELCRQIMKMKPAKLILLGKGENSIYDVHYELRALQTKVELIPIIADVRDGTRIQSVFSQYRPQVVFHAAAHKHVPLMELQPDEAVHNNIFGTKIMAEAADRAACERFILISTDKAVNPTSIMGATKRVAELIIQRMNAISTTKFAAVRFGNVLGSRGSVIPLFKKQITAGGPVTITHPDMRRYFMTIPEASQLVLQAGAMTQGGEVYVLDMGKPVKIMDMAKDLIELSGLVPNKDIKIEITGLRPGEKLFEELLAAEDGTCATMHEKIFVANIKDTDEEMLHQGLLTLQQEKDTEIIIHILEILVPSYTKDIRHHSVSSIESQGVTFQPVRNKDELVANY